MLDDVGGNSLFVWKIAGVVRPYNEIMFAVFLAMIERRVMFGLWMLLDMKTQTSHTLSNFDGVFNHLHRELLEFLF